MVVLLAGGAPLIIAYRLRLGEGFHFLLLCILVE
jgi:hypothetical protein